MTSQFLEEMSDIAGTDLRGADVVPGGVVGEQNIEGAPTKYFKGKSKVRVGNTELAERVELYDIARHDLSMVPPTIASKRMADYPGRFTMRRPKNWEDGYKEPIEDTCELCDIRRREENVVYPGRRKFYSKWDLTNHYRLMHTLEWEAIENDRRDGERQDEQSQMRTLISSIAQMIPAQQAPAKREAAEPLVCADCGETIEGRDGFAKARHRKVCTAQKDGG